VIRQVPAAAEAASALINNGKTSPTVFNQERRDDVTVKYEAGTTGTRSVISR
jgi:hypothetical protein